MALPLLEFSRRGRVEGFVIYGHFTQLPKNTPSHYRVPFVTNISLLYGNYGVRAYPGKGIHRTYDYVRIRPAN
jgi:hypothetical protein